MAGLSNHKRLPLPRKINDKKIMRILLIKPSCTVYKPDPTLPSATLPFGIAYLASFLLSKGEQVGVIDALSEGIDNAQKFKNKTRIGLSNEKIKRKIKGFNPDIIGITSMFTAFSHDAHTLAALIKKINPNIKVVLGGAHASILPELSIKDKNIDIVVKGEGEITFWEIINAIKRGKDFTRIKGTVVRRGRSIIVNPSREYIQNLDILPFPAYDRLPMETYFKAAGNSPFVTSSKLCGIISSRGCPGDCTYCSIHSVWGHTWRGRSPKNVVDEMEFLIKKFGIKEFSFLDDSVACLKTRMGEICKEIIKRKLKIRWSTPNGISHWTLDERLLDKMKASGCYRITFGIESGNLCTREFIGWKKNFSLKQAKRITKYANKIGLWTISTFIFGFPYEDRQSIEDTIDFAIKSDTDFAAFFLLMPFPGTRVYEIFKKEGLLNFDRLLDPIKGRQESQLAKLGAALAQNGCRTKYFSQKELQELLGEAYSRFWRARFISFLNPIRVIQKINSFDDVKYTTKICVTGVKMKINQLRHGGFTAHMISRVNKDNLREGIYAAKN